LVGDGQLVLSFQVTVIYMVMWSLSTCPSPSKRVALGTVATAPRSCRPSQTSIFFLEYIKDLYIIIIKKNNLTIQMTRFWGHTHLMRNFPHPIYFLFLLLLPAKICGDLLLFSYFSRKIDWVNSALIDACVWFSV